MNGFINEILKRISVNKLKIMLLIGLPMLLAYQKFYKDDYLTLSEKTRELAGKVHLVELKFLVPMVLAFIGILVVVSFAVCIILGFIHGLIWHRQVGRNNTSQYIRRKLFKEQVENFTLNMSAWFMIIYLYPYVLGWEIEVNMIALLFSAFGITIALIQGIRFIFCKEPS